MKALVLVLGACAWACPGRPPDTAPDAGPDDGGPEPRTLAFEVDAPGAVPSVHLRGATLAGSSLSIRVASSTATAVHGLAFRLRFDPDALRFINLEAAASWPVSRVVLAKEAQPGLLVAAVGAMGKVPGLAPGEQELARLEFEVVKEAESAVVFVAERSALLVADGEPLGHVAWKGGALRLVAK